MKITIEIMGGKNIEGKASCFAEFVQRHKFELSNANLKHTDLSGAKLTYANLRHADLSGADLRDADLLNADLSSTKLKGTNLAGADLSDANMKHADLRGADLDYASMFTLKCESFGATLDKRQMAQQAYHFCRHKCDDPEVRAAQEALIPLANQFHHVDKCGKVTTHPVTTA